MRLGLNHLAFGGGRFRKVFGNNQLTNEQRRSLLSNKAVKVETQTGGRTKVSGPRKVINEILNKRA